MQKKGKITAAKVRYLSALAEMDKDGRGIRSAALARRLGVSRPSVHAMIAKLSDEGLVEKEHYGIIYLTDEGMKQGTRYHQLYQKISHEMHLDDNSIYSMISAAAARN